MTAMATAGLRGLYNRISPKQDHAAADELVANLTTVEGFFDPAPPVPLLGSRYQYVKKIGRGSFAVIIRAEDTFDPDRRHVAIKVMHAQYLEIGKQEGRHIRAINGTDPHDVAHIVRCLNCFTFQRHYCIVFELMATTPIRHCIDLAASRPSSGAFGGAGGTEGTGLQLRMNAVRKVAAQLFAALSLLERAAVIHADIKPENILLRDNDATCCAVKLADFGNAMAATEEDTSLYFGTFELQSLWYRAPEVILGLPFGPPIDMWSAGCVLAELYLGDPLFSGHDNAAVLTQIVDVLGPLPQNPFSQGSHFDAHEDAVVTSDRLESTRSEQLKRLMAKFGTKDSSFAGFILGLLAYSPERRLTPAAALRHPFMARLFPFSLAVTASEEGVQPLHSPCHSPRVSADVRPPPETAEPSGFSAVCKTEAGVTSRSGSTPKPWWQVATACSPSQAASSVRDSSDCGGGGNAADLHTQENPAGSSLTEVSLANTRNVTWPSGPRARKSCQQSLARDRAAQQSPKPGKKRKGKEPATGAPVPVHKATATPKSVTKDARRRLRASPTKTRPDDVRYCVEAHPSSRRDSGVGSSAKRAKVLTRKSPHHRKGQHRPKQPPPVSVEAEAEWSIGSPADGNHADDYDALELFGLVQTNDSNDVGDDDEDDDARAMFGLSPKKAKSRGSKTSNPNHPEDMEEDVLLT